MRHSEPNFDRATLFNFDCSSSNTRRMSEKQFYEHVTREVSDVVRTHPDVVREVIHTCYSSISILDVDKIQAYEDARACALEDIRSHIARLRTLASARRSAAPAQRNAPIASMPDRRGGADDIGDDDRLD